MSFDKKDGVEVTLPPLTDAQKQAVFTLTGPILADSVPGSGKTRTITCRLAYLANLYQPESILAITFTKGAAAEMSIRAKSMIKTRRQLPKVTHFHSFAYHLLKDIWGGRRLSIAFPERIIGKLGGIYQELTGATEKADLQKIENYRQLISRAKSTGLDRVQDAEEIQLNFNKWSPESDLIRELWERLDGWYAEYSLLDFDDLLNCAVKEINRLDDWRNRLHEKYRHVLVDEFQDTNPPQWAFIRSIVENRPITARSAGTSLCPINFDWTGRSLLVCGDGDQSIYGFRNADITNILQFPEVYQNCLTVDLKTNYRSTQVITACANRLISHNRLRRAKAIEPNRLLSGAKIALVSSSSEAEQTRRVAHLLLELYNGTRRIAVLARHHNTLDSIREVCENIGVPSTASGGVPFFELRPVQTVRRLLTAAFDLHDSDLLLASLAETGENEIWRRRKMDSQAFRQSLWEFIWQLPELNEPEAEFFLFLLRVNRLLQHRRYSEAVELCFERTGIFSEICWGRDPIRMEQLVDTFHLIHQVKEIEKLPHADKNSLLNLFQSGRNLQKNQSVSLLTIHASKGWEFDAVIVVDVTDGVLPQFEAEDEEEERRLFYVAVTRAIDRLVLCFNKARPSRFLHEITSTGENDFIRLGES